MANAFKVIDTLTQYAVKDFLNSLQMASKIDRQLDKSNVFNGKVGATARIRRPVRFESTEGAEITTGQVSDIEEGDITMTLDQRHKVVMGITSQDLTLSVQYLRERYIKPAMIELAQKVETEIGKMYKYIPNFVGTPGTKPNSFLTVAAADAKLDELGVPMDNTRCAFFGPTESMNIANAFTGVFPSPIPKTAIEKAMIKDLGNLALYKNQSLAMHTVGVATGTPLVNGASQNVTYAASKDTQTQTLITDGWTNSQTGILKAGDVFTLAGVYAVNRRTRATTGELAQFTVISDADSDGSGNATFTISPPIITSGPYQTCDAAPANNAAITVKTGTGGSTYRQNIAWHPNALTMAMVPLHLPTGNGALASRADYNGISIRLVNQYDITLDKEITRADILFGLKPQNPDFACRITS